MPQSNIRLDVVTLLCDADFRRRPDTNRWSHLDGRPFTKVEQALAFSATREEFTIAADQIKREGATGVSIRKQSKPCPSCCFPTSASFRPVPLSAMRCRC